LNSEHDDDIPSPVIPKCMSGPSNTSNKDTANDDTDDLVPGTPPAKKFKSLFFGLSQSTTSGSQPTEPIASTRPFVLAEDSDYED